MRFERLASPGEVRQIASQQRAGSQDQDEQRVEPAEERQQLSPDPVAGEVQVHHSSSVAVALNSKPAAEVAVEPGLAGLGRCVPGVEQAAVWPSRVRRAAPARTILLESLEECNPDASNNRASY